MALPEQRARNRLCDKTGASTFSRAYKSTLRLCLRHDLAFVCVEPGPVGFWSLLLAA